MSIDELKAGDGIGKNGVWAQVTKGLVSFEVFHVFRSRIHTTNFTGNVYVPMCKKNHYERPVGFTSRFGQPKLRRYTSNPSKTPVQLDV